MTFHNEDYVNGVALVLRGESMKARAYVTHGSSIGTIRERIVGNFIRHDTPERFRVETGIIRNNEEGDHFSRQCDLLIHEPGILQPIYRYDDFVVVRASEARAVVEVKSQLDKAGFEAFLDVHASVVVLEFLKTGPIRSRIPTFGYGLEGSSLTTVADYLKDALAQDRLQDYVTGPYSPTMNWPSVVAI